MNILLWLFLATKYIQKWHNLSKPNFISLPLHVWSYLIVEYKYFLLYQILIMKFPYQYMISKYFQAYSYHSFEWLIHKYLWHDQPHLVKILILHIKPMG